MTRKQALRLMRIWEEANMKLAFFTKHAEAAEYALACGIVLGKPYYVSNQSARKWVVRPNVWEE
jgi:hypothetical protein